MAIYQPVHHGLIELTVKLEHYKCTKGEAKFILAEVDQACMGVVEGTVRLSLKKSLSKIINAKFPLIKQNYPVNKPDSVI